MKDKKDNKVPSSEGGKSARQAIVGDGSSAIPIPNLGQAVPVQAAPSRTTRDQVIIKLSTFKNDCLPDNAEKTDNIDIDNMKDKIVIYRYSIVVKEGQIQPNRIINLIMAFKVLTDPTLDNLCKTKMDIINENLKPLDVNYKVKIYIKRFENNKNFKKPLNMSCDTLNFKNKAKLRKIFNGNDKIKTKTELYNKIHKTFFIQETEENVELVIRESRDLEQESDDDDLLNRTDEDDTEMSTFSNGPDDTIYVPPAEHVMPGGSRVPPPVIQMRHIINATRRSSLSVNDEIVTQQSSEAGNSATPVEAGREEVTPDETKKGGKNKAGSKNGKNPVKRGGGNDDEGNLIIPNKKPMRRSYAEVAREEGSRMCEIRKRGGQSMVQVDYDYAIIKLMFALMKHQKEKKERDRNTWRIRGSGLSRSAVWLGVGSDACVDFLRENVPKIVENDEEDNSPLLYEFYGPGERPFRSLRWRVPYMWFRIDIRDLQDMIFACNPELWIQIERANGERTDPVLRLVKRVPDKRDNDPDNGTGFVSFLIEVEEDLMRVLIEDCLGVLRIGATEGRLSGSGIVTGVREFLGVGDDDDKDKTNDDDKDKNDGNDKDKKDEDKMDDDNDN